MSKRTPLTFTLDKAPAPAKPRKAEPAAKENPQPHKHANDATETKGKVGRAGRQFIAAHVLPEAAKQLKLLAVQQERTTQAVLIEAINDLFAKYGLSRIADD